MRLIGADANINKIAKSRVHMQQSRGKAQDTLGYNNNLRKLGLRVLRFNLDELRASRA